MSKLRKIFVWFRASQRSSRKRRSNQIIRALRARAVAVSDAIEKRDAARTLPHESW